MSDDLSVGRCDVEGGDLTRDESPRDAERHSPQFRPPVWPIQRNPLVACPRGGEQLLAYSVLIRYGFKSREAGMTGHERCGGDPSDTGAPRMTARVNVSTGTLGCSAAATVGVVAWSPCFGR